MKVKSSPSGVHVERGKAYTVEIRIDPPVPARAVDWLARAFGFLQPSVTTLDGDDPSRGTHFLILATYDPPPRFPPETELNDQKVWSAGAPKDGAQLFWLKAVPV
jgi:hypothetical protein